MKRIGRRLGPGKGRFPLRRCSRGMKRACAWMLCAGMVAGSGTANIAAAAASSGGEDVAEFKMTPKMLRGAMEKALLEGKPVDASAFDIQGEYAGDYDELLDGPEGDAKIYELPMPSGFKRKHRKAAVKLRVFVRFDAGCLAGALEEGGDEETADAGYEFCGDEKMIFLLSNDTEKEQEAAVIVGGKTSGPIVVAPESQIDMGLRASVSLRASDIVMMPLASGSDAGADGAAGVDGATGVDGTAGADGVDGADTVDGTDSTDGAGAVEGTDGTGAAEGADGADAADGTDGAGAKNEGGADTGGGESLPAGGGRFPDATSSDADDYNEEIFDATSSDVELEPLLGELYDAVLLDGHAVTAFAVPAAELGIGDVNLASSSDAVRFHAASENLSVTAWVKEDAVPETAELKVKELSEKGEMGTGRRLAQDALDQARIPYDDMLACDLYFEDGGERIEPDGGRIQVAMEVNREILPEDVSADTLAVQHLKEKPGGGITVESVAGAAENAGGGVEITGEAAVAEFKVNSFSKFTVTWGTGLSTDGKIAFRLLDTAGEPVLPEPEMELEIKAGQGFSVASRMPYISGYDYQSAYYIKDGARVPVTELRAGDRSISYRSEESDFWKRVDSEAISVVYAGDGLTAGASDPEVILQHEKKAIRKGDGTYDLTLTVSGDVGTEQQRQPMDVLFVLDRSGSMAHKRNALDKKSSAEAVGDAIKQLVGSVERNEKLDARYSLVGFNGADDYDMDKTLIPGAKPLDDAKLELDWTKDADEIKTKANPDPSVLDSDLTNYHAGLVTAAEAMKGARPEAIKVLIFLSDGEPNMCYGADGFSMYATRGDGMVTYEAVGTVAAGASQAFNADYFFTVGVLTNGGILSRMIGTRGLGPTNKYFKASDTEQLDQAFADIYERITKLGASNVAITDHLSEYVQMVKTDSGQFEGLKIVVTDDKGVKHSGEGQLKLGDTLIKADYNRLDKRIRLIFPQDYELQPGYTYEVTAHIELSNSAYNEHREHKGAYPNGQRGDENTGTHAEQEGFYCNEKSELTYLYGGKNQMLQYPHPVVQAETGSVQVKKLVSGNMADEKKEFGFQFQIEKNGYIQRIGKFTLKHGETYVIDEYLRLGTTVKVEETDYESDGYTTSVYVGDGAIGQKSRSAQVDIDSNADITVTYENKKNIATPMGIFNDSHPYAAMLLTASLGLGLAAFLKRKESAGEEKGRKS